MPGWYRDFKDSGARIVGLIQEQHPERCRLFMAWKQMDFPILVDALNRIGVHAVPLMWAIDEHGVVRKTRPKADWIRNEFLPADYPEPEGKGKVEQPSAGVRAYLAGDWNSAVEAFSKAVAGDPDSGELWFRLGCAYRARHDSALAEQGDFQRAIDAWSKALERNPRNYIFRRRLQQYGPRLMKPYPFYDWVEQARADLAARGEEVPPLTVALEGSEIAQPQRRGAGVQEASAGDEKEPDPDRAIEADRRELVAVEAVVAPRPVEAGGSARIYLRFVPSAKAEVTWDNEAGPLQVWLEPPPGCQVSRRLLQAGLPPKPSSKETRSLEVELSIPETASERLELRGYALYYVCEGIDDACVYRRLDFTVEMPVAKKD